VNVEPNSSNPSMLPPQEVPPVPPVPADTAQFPPQPLPEGASEEESPGDVSSTSVTQPFPPPLPDAAAGAAGQPLAEEPPAEDEPEPDVPFADPLEFIDETVAEEDLKFDWYILKVQVNREESIKDALLRRVKMNGLERYFKEIIVPTEDVVEFTKTGKKRVVKKKLYPGYILVNMSVSDESWFMVRETPGIGDFTGASGKPTPMDPKDVERILRSTKVLPDEEGPAVKTAIPFKSGDRVRVKEGYFQNFEGDVDKIDQATGRVTVLVEIFGRRTPVELDHWQIEAV
jgi:transcriptional antiterminator NusG